MKFLLIVLAIRLIGLLIGNKQKITGIEELDLDDDIVYHPAEIDLR